MDRLTPTPAQEEAIQRIVNEPTRAALSGAGLGTGKTLMALESSARMGAGQTLISAPLHTKYGWRDTAEGQGLTDFRVINRNTKEGRAALADFEWGRDGIYFIGRELARLMDWSDARPDMVIHDESHSWSNPKSRGFKNAQKLAKVSGYTMAQSATWYGSIFSNAWTTSRVLWPGRNGANDIADRSRYRWQARYCDEVYDPFAPMQKRVVGEKKPGEFVGLLPLYIDLKSTVADAIEIPIYVDLSPRQRKLYNSVEKEGIAWLDDNPLVADLPLTQRIRLRQLTLGECSINDAGEVVFADDASSTMLDALKEMLSDFGDEKVLVVTDSAKFARLAAARIPGSFAWTGDKSEGEREAAKSDFIHGNLKYIIATQASISEGTNGLQQVCHIGVECSRSDQVVLGEQVRGRLARTGQTKQVLWYHLMARDTIDDPQAETLLSKRIAMKKSLRLTA